MKKLTVTNHSFSPLVWVQTSSSRCTNFMAHLEWTHAMYLEVQGSCFNEPSFCWRQQKERQNTETVSSLFLYREYSSQVTCTAEEVNVEKHSLLLSTLPLFWRQKIFTNKYLVPYQVTDHLPGSFSSSQLNPWCYHCQAMFHLLAELIWTPDTVQ